MHSKTFLAVLVGLMASGAVTSPLPEVEVKARAEQAEQGNPIGGIGTPVNGWRGPFGGPFDPRVGRPGYNYLYARGEQADQHFDPYNNYYGGGGVGIGGVAAGGVRGPFGNTAGGFAGGAAGVFARGEQAEQFGGVGTPVNGWRGPFGGPFDPRLY